MDPINRRVRCSLLLVLAVLPAAAVGLVALVGPGQSRTVAAVTSLAACALAWGVWPERPVAAPRRDLHKAVHDIRNALTVMVAHAIEIHARVGDTSADDSFTEFEIASRRAARIATALVEPPSRDTRQHLG